jgi:PD-(D/E)XK nuclease superfamily
LVSFTQIDQYLRCPLRIPIPLYRRLEPDFVPAARAFGSGIHAAAAVLFRNVAHGERQRVEGVQGCFERFSNLEVGRQPLWYGEKLCQT